MLYYLQRECNSETTIANGSIIKFETPIALSQTSSLTPSVDFIYQEDGSIDVLRAGTYTVFWYVTSMAGFSTIGQSYQLKKLDYSLATPSWNLVAGTSNHVKVSQTLGFAIVIISQDEIDEYGKATIALFNTANASEELTFFAPKAGILISGLDFNDLEDKLTTVDNQINDIFTQLENIQDFVRLSDVTEILSLTSELLGLGVAVINSGYTFNFWGIGTLNHQQTLNSGIVYYLIESSQYEPLSLYQGDSTIGTLWIETPAPSTSIYSFPIRFDNTGIYFMPDITYQNLPVGTTFRFTQALILVDGSIQP